MKLEMHHPHSRRKPLRPDFSKGSGKGVQSDGL